MNTIASRIKKIREMRGYTQKELADRAKMHETLIQQYEHGRRNPKQEQLVRIAEALEVDRAFLVPSKFDTPMAVYAILYDFIEQYGDISFTASNATAFFGVQGEGRNYSDYSKIINAMSAHEKLSLDDFMKWLIDQPITLHNGEIVKKGNKP